MIQISLDNIDSKTFYLSIIITVPMLALSVRRVHDINKSGWWILPKFLTFTITCFLSHYKITHQEQMPVFKVLVVIGGIYCLFLLFFLLRKGDQNVNQYGPPAVK